MKLVILKLLLMKTSVLGSISPAKEVTVFRYDKSKDTGYTEVHGCSGGNVFFQKFIPGE